MIRHEASFSYGLVLLAALLISPCVAESQAHDTGHPVFLSPHASPIVESNGVVFVVNTPADTVDVIDVSSRAIITRINVGIDPVSLALRPDGKEIWVANHVSDSVSVIDLDPTSLRHFQVIATVQEFNHVTGATRFDEPVGIAFANSDKAYIALSSENQIAVINVVTRQVEKRLNITAQDPRAIAVHGDRLYVIPFESGNQTQISGCVDKIDENLCTFDAIEHVIENNNVLSLFAVVDIVKNRLNPDRDLFVFNTANDQLVEIVDGLGTLLYGLTISSGGQVFVTQTDARNDVNGRAGTFGDGLAEMENRAFLNRITQVDCSADTCTVPRFMDLEPLPPAQPAPGMAFATPFAIAISADDATLLVSAASSNKLFSVDAVSGQLLGQVEVGKVPRGIALESSDEGRPLQAWVFNAADNTVSLIDVSDPVSPVLADTITLDDPTHPAVKRGRIAFNDAGASTTGTFSCESCHPDGGTDQLLWVLDTPPCNIGGCNQIPPRITMPIRGLRDTAPYHWDGIPGDPYGGNNTSNINGSDPANCSLEEAASCTRFLVDGSLASTMCEASSCPLNDEGKDGALTAVERDDMAKFLLSVPYPPAQKRSYNNVLSNRAESGFQLFHIDGDLQGDPEPNVCGNCHRMPFWVSTNTPGTGMEAPTWRGAYDRWLILPQGRLNIIDFDFYRDISAAGVPEQSMWQLSWAGRTRFNPVWDMVLEGSTGFSGSFARNLTLSRETANASLTGELLDALELSAAEGGIVLQGEGVMIESGPNGSSATPVALQFSHQRQGGVYLERSHGDSFTREELLSLAAAGTFTGTFTGRLGTRVDVDHPQPGIWTRGPIEQQRGKQIFPLIYGDETSMIVSGRHVQKGGKLYVDGRRVPGTVRCQEGVLPDCREEMLEVQLTSLPSPDQLHFLQVQNPSGLYSNDFIFHTSSLGEDNCPDIPNPEQEDSDKDGIGDRCDDNAFEFDIEKGLSGAWYDPAHDGEGWFVQILDDNRALVYWFTYTPPAVGGEKAQSWIGGVGEIKGSSIVVTAAESVIADGPPFGLDFDPTRVHRRPWGKFVLSFSDCNGGVMYYRSEDLDYGSGSLDLVRLSEIDTQACGSQVGLTAVQQAEDDFAVSASISGAWYDPSHDGEGWLLEVLPGGRALLAWFSYDPDGNQAWFLNTGAVEGNRIRFDLTVPSGTDFGPTFNPGDVSRPPWGTAVFTFDDCNSGSMSYESQVEGYGSGSLGLKRLTSLSGLECQ
jgi:YVTN family beta-propeller protein